MKIEERLKERGLELPAVTVPIASYVPAVLSGNHVFVSGQLPFVAGKLKAEGRVGEGVTAEEGQECAKIAALNCLAAIKSLVGDLEKVIRIVRITGYVRSAEGFTGQPGVVNGASNLIVDIFGDAGRHARSAVGVSELPLGAPVEVEMIAEVSSWR
jgi:enamine deaminase RidA (YjgF/YER057c/UK114 family)